MRNAVRYEVTMPRGVRDDRFELETQAGAQAASTLAVDVIYTSEAGTRSALKTAWALARGLGARVCLVFVYAVPYALPLNEPAVSLPFLKANLAKLASGFPGEASVNIYLCREPFATLCDVLRGSSLVVLGGRVRWWVTQERRLARRLKKLGHHVVFVESR